MKKFIYLFIILISFSSYGQIGISYDFGLNYMDGNTSPTNASEFNYNVALGAVYRMEMNEKLDLEIGANVSIPYFIEWDFSDIESGRAKLRTSATAKYYLSEAFSLKGGLLFGYRLKEDDNFDSLTNASLSTLLGVGWDITEKFIISTGFILPLTNEGKGGRNTRNYSFGFGVQYFFFTF
jgi:hypothetical protein